MCFSGKDQLCSKAMSLEMSNETDYDIIVIGGGIVGLASAYKIGLRHPNLRIAVLEKEKQVASHQTGRNSGVIHSGLYYKPGTYKARTCAEGRKELIEFAKKHKISYKICGKIIVATKKKELAGLEKLFKNGLANQIEGIEKISPYKIRTIEPFCQGIEAIHVPFAGIIDFVEVAEKICSLLEADGQNNKVFTSCEVTGLNKRGEKVEIATSNGQFTAQYIINCAGLQSDRIAKMAGINCGIRIIPFRSDYYELTESADEKVKGLIYPVTDPDLPFLGVHLTRTIHGKVECGPNAALAFKREGYRKSDFNFKDMWNSLTYPGTWLMFMRHWWYGLEEYRKSLSKRYFFKQLKRFIPTLQAKDIRPGISSVRAQALGRDGELVDDFRIEKDENAIHVLNAPSPAATASLAIGEAVSEIATEHFNL